MGGKRTKNDGVYAAICMVLLFSPLVLSQSSQIPADKSKVNSWFSSVIKPVNQRSGTIDPDVAKAEANPKIIKVRKSGGGDFNTITKAVESVPRGNSKRVIISIGSGTYKEKITVPRDKPFITFLGDPKSMPTLTFDGTARQYGTVDSATLITLSSYFVGAYLNIVNSSPMPSGNPGAQAVALRVSGDRSAFYNCKMVGFQDTVCDDRGNHFFKDCNIKGTVDFIFGSGTSLYLGTEIFIENDPRLTVITAQARESSSEKTGYSFVHGKITGAAKGTFLGRAWKSSPRVVYSYTDMSKVVVPSGWSSEMQPERAKTVFYGEYKCTGEGAKLNKRVVFVKKLTDNEAKPFLSLDYIGATKWLLPPPKI
ncbi:putative pectinesterase 49 [Hibiscus syriacus]|uniref:Pectinesterase n=1 Tax=Hibiscus syriacus TaxID=106335 RepID=A0A6A3BMA3_HIBSY|nr:putative pectinesterase 63 [Hibiscus syriacus]KAE8715979.1 putative pectinesterase 49 [Hibiscus syriacus]